MNKLRYLSNKNTYLKYSYLALKERFKTKEDFDKWYESIKSDKKKDIFLKVATYYLALVKNGDWYVDIPDSNKKIDYFTNTFKYIAIFSLIESLSSDKYIDYYEYLKKKNTQTKFPIDKEELENKYRSYKQEYGSIRRCISFFTNLSIEKQKELVSKLEVEGNDASIENFAKYLYRLRSEFVHEAELIHEMSSVPVYGLYNNKGVMCYLSIDDAMEFFEEGLMIWCQKQ